MSIRYAEITIARNLEKESWFSYFKNLIGEEDVTSNNDTIILSFDDGYITDTKTALEDKQFKFGYKSRKSFYPIYFNKPDKEVLFLQDPLVKNGYLYMNFNIIFQNDPKFSTLNKVASIYNTIYYSQRSKNQVFSILKHGHNHRYLLAYNNSYFDKSDIIYFVHMLFTNSFTYNNNM
jgi:hypothetical protein